MAESRPQPLRLKELSPPAIADALARDPRLLLPVGTCESHGPHLPIGCDTIIIDRLVDDLSAELQILRAPTLEYGVNVPHERPAPGGAGLRRKSLLRTLNDLIDAWEAGGVKEFVLVTANGHDAHVEALSTVITTAARVQVIDVLGIVMPEATDSPYGALHGDEIDTSLMLFLHPDLVDMGRAEDFPLPSRRGLRRLGRANLRVMRASAGSMGNPSAASAAKGEAMYKRIKRLIRDKVLLAPQDDED
ncbi:MAG: creatininase family protein [Gemmatimonadaceae bacterium]|nr:creatininase family protein [Gemmatimonadaceae bacterium]